MSGDIFILQLNNSKREYTFHNYEKMAWKILNIVLLVSCFLFGLHGVKSVKTKIGLINGLVEDMQVFGKHFKVSKYLGIPYAEPPVGNLRFQKPESKLPLKEPLNAVQYGNACLQVDIDMQPKGEINYSEDCLYLNIYAPMKPEQGKKLAVMVWFHGGGFIIGSSDIYPADHLAAYGDVVVVSVNYRLTVFGFLCTGDENALGNYGLWDQQMALDWVNKNIEAFGGDPAMVTIFGESAGAASVIYQGLYPKNRGLFQRLVAQSGSAGSWWASNDQCRENTEKLAKLTGCTRESSRATVTCLKSIPGEELIGILDNFENGFKAVPIPFIPNCDEEFIKIPGKHTFVPGNELPVESHDFFMSLDIMVGMNCGEGSLSLSPFFGVPDPLNFLPNKTEFRHSLVPLIQNLAFPGNTDEIVTDAIVAEYTNWKNPDNEYLIREEFLSMHSDFTFTEPLYRVLDYHSESTSRTYMFYFEEKTRNHLFGNVQWFDKLGHGDEIPFIFGYENADHLKGWKFYANEWETQLSKRVIKLWTNFAKTGNTNLPDKLDIDWLPYTRKHQHYLQIKRDMTSLNVKQRWNTRRTHFWGNLLPGIVKASQCSRDMIDSRQQSCAAKEKCSP